MKFMAESYLPTASRDLEAISARVRAAADELTREGAAVRYVEALVVPADEMCLLVYEAGSADLVREAGRRAGIVCERVVETTGDLEGFTTATKGELR